MAVEFSEYHWDLFRKGPVPEGALIVISRSMPSYEHGDGIYAIVQFLKPFTEADLRAAIEVCENAVVASFRTKTLGQVFYDYLKEEGFAKTLTLAGEIDFHDVDSPSPTVSATTDTSIDNA